MITLPSWNQTWREYGASSPDETLFKQLVACWSEKHRRYHTLQHLRECFEQFEAVRSRAEAPAEIMLALWFHDAFYDPRREDNEQRSADWARECIVAAGVPAAKAQRMHDLVMATCHDAVPDDPDARLLVDVDLSILGADAARFDQSDLQIREEYAHVPDSEYRQGRIKVLRSFLDRPRLYSTDDFHAVLEQRARNNLERALARLQ
jgi:predicted metal-dependent HD superfamily phosphohydrolase